MVGMLFIPALSASASISDLVISEVLPSPAGDDGLYEFIEIYNSGSSEVDLTGLYLDDAEGSGTSTAYSFVVGTKISAGGYLAFYSEKTRLSLTNSGEVARVLGADKTLITELVYMNAPEGSSCALKPDGSYVWTSILTPNAENQFSVVVTPTPTPDSPISPPEPYAPEDNKPVDYTLTRNLIVSEILPDPEGNDGENEFIEIHNPNSSVVNLTGFYVDDAEGGSSPHLLSDETIIEAGGYLVFYSRDTKIALNNTGDSARLLYPDKTIIISAVVDKSPHEDWSFSRKSDGAFAWTSEPTPGEENEFVTPTEEPSPTPTPKPTASSKPTATPKPTKAPKPTATPKGRVIASDGATTKNFTVRRAGGVVLGNNRATKTIAIADLNKEEIGTLVTIQGSVALLPGTFDTRLMYLSGSGVGIFLPSSNYPKLVLGDIVSVTGVLAKPEREMFVSVRTGDDVVKEDSGSVPKPHLVSLNNLDDSKIGWLVKIEGKVTKSEINIFEFGTDGKVIKVLLGEDKKEFKVGDNVSVVGVLSVDAEGLRILASTVETVVFTETGSKIMSFISKIITHWKMTSAVACFGLALGLSLVLDFQIIRRRVVLARTFSK
jgi:hypothetical protein